MFLELARVISCILILPYYVEVNMCVVIYNIVTLILWYIIKHHLLRFKYMDLLVNQNSKQENEN